MRYLPSCVLALFLAMSCSVPALARMAPDRANIINSSRDTGTPHVMPVQDGGGKWSRKARAAGDRNSAIERSSPNRDAQFRRDVDRANEHNERIMRENARKAESGQKAAPQQQERATQARAKARAEQPSRDRTPDLRALNSPVPGRTGRCANSDAAKTAAASPCERVPGGKSRSADSSAPADGTALLVPTLQK